MELSEIQYNAVMQAINNAKAEIADDTFIDPYGEAPADYTNENLLKALEQVEDKMIAGTGFFSCLRLHRDDFNHKAGQKWDASGLSDADMKGIAEDIGETCMEQFWYSLDYQAEEQGLTKITE